MKKFVFIIQMESNLNNYSIGDFGTREEAEKYINDKGLDIYPYIPIIVKKMV